MFLYNILYVRLIFNGFALYVYGFVLYFYGFVLYFMPWSNILWFCSVILCFCLVVGGSMTPNQKDADRNLKPGGGSGASRSLI